jgi:DNA replication protein DnaC
MNPMPELIPMLKQLRLSGVLDSLENRNRQAIEEKLSYTDFLATIVQDEIARRTQKKLALAFRRANFRNQKTLEEFDFSFNPTINQGLIAKDGGRSSHLKFNGVWVMRDVATILDSHVSFLT